MGGGGFGRDTVEAVMDSGRISSLTQSEQVAVAEDGLLPKDKRLNPEWVEWLMGFPRGWTEVEPVEDIIDSSSIKPNKKEKA